MADPNECFTCTGFQECTECTVDSGLQTDLAICKKPSTKNDPESACAIDEFAEPQYNELNEIYYVCTKCTDIDPNAAECFNKPSDGTDEISKCIDGYVVVDNTCVACQDVDTEFCVKCSTPGTCEECDEGYVLQQTGICTGGSTCDAGEPEEQQNFQKENFLNCITTDCTPGDNCLKCIDDNKCAICERRNYLEDGLCKPCMVTEPNMCSTCNTVNDCIECVQGAVLLTVGQTKFCVNSEQSTLPVDGDLGEGTPDENTPTTEWANGPYPSTWLSDPTDPTSPVVDEVYYVSDPVKEFDPNAITGRHDDDNNGVELLSPDNF